MTTITARVLSPIRVLTAGLLVAMGVSLATPANAASGYPINKPREVDWSFSGPFGTYDKAQLQRGLKIYTEVCAACHSMNLLFYRNLADLGYTDEQIKNYAAEYEVTDGPNDDGEMFERPARATDRFKGPYLNVKEAAYANNGALPPDFSLLAKARAPERGFPTFIFDIFTMYAENGADYIYSLLVGYQEPPEGVEVSEGLHYNPYFVAGSALAMAQPLYEESVEYDDGTVASLDQQAKDISAFMMWAADPNLPQRKQRGFIVVLFLLGFAGLLYATKKKVWANVPH
ncbi:cytochrome c1 [Ahrensia sp. R2A130]|uniref:cytochrome c1 n=1 Tax=Ahrensia sp. R2A130 TaxID=744979 RepID=UPI0001E0F815|nr:cytochrome c1 [Ahrensia sp. R2A130]EFL91003.1 cytochrome B/c1 [Ahrensia sp. R2A130]